MTQIILNSVIAILIATAFVTTTAAALRGENRAVQKVPVRAKARRHPMGGKTTK
ncbi:hypothetical protein [Rhizobium mesoamericanum]|uniref:hypothetical protein n=1 Tax=Rhizobium mesoamericanum TaxID=1079800 RepID=UPI00041F0D25|nr:hypothetical protein [Rhizobium mesoamericanum]